MGSKFFLSKIEKKNVILNSQNIRMLQTNVKNDIYNKCCLIHNTSKSFIFLFVCFVLIV